MASEAGGDEFSLADAALAPWWQRMHVVLAEYRGFALSPDDPAFARLQVSVQRQCLRPTVGLSGRCSGIQMRSTS